jgi:carboxypeptidase D
MLKRGVVGLPTDRERDSIEERIPLGTDRMEMDDLEDRERRQRKGKGRQQRERDEEERGETVFALGDEDEDDDFKDRR